MRSISIAGIALTCARGANVADALADVRAGRTGHTTLTIPTVDGERAVPFYAMPTAAATDTPARLVPLCRAALADAGLADDVIRDMPLIVGSSSLRAADAERGDEASFGMNTVTAPLKSALALTGPDYTINTACASSAHALLLAHTLLNAGSCRAALVLGVEVANLTTAAGFRAMQLLGTTVRPFDRLRDGLVLGEAIAAIVLTSEPIGRLRLLGGANRIDTANPAGADTSGAALRDLMRRACRRAGVTPADISLIKAHAAGSPVNDAAEATALVETFATLPPVTSLKGYLGHLLGASGCAELALLTACWRDGFTPAAAGFVSPDPALPLQPLQQPLPGVPRYALLNFVGFGGGQAALVIGHEAL